MNIQNTHANPFFDSNTENSHEFLNDSAENNAGNEELAILPLEAMVISNITQCAFMGARSPWVTT